MRIAAMLVLSALSVAAALAGEEPPPPLAEIAAAVRARESVTLPRGLTYESAATTGVRTDTTWVERGACVIRTRSSAADLVLAWDGTSSFTAHRSDGEPWTGHRGAARPVRYPCLSPICAFLAPQGRPLSDELSEPSSQVLGWSDVHGVPCVAVRIATMFDPVLELDPARGFVPLRVDFAVGEGGDATVRRQSAEVSIAGSSYRIWQSFTVTAASDLGGGAWVPSSIETTRYDLPQPTSARLVASDRRERLRPGVVGSVLDGAGQLALEGRHRMLRFDGDEQWEVPDRVFGLTVGPWPPPIWLRPWALALEILAVSAIAAVVVSRLIARDRRGGVAGG